MTFMAGIVDGAIPSTDRCLTLRCPSELISLVDTSFRAFLCIASSNGNCSTRLNDSFPVQDSTYCLVGIETASCCCTNNGSNGGEQIGAPV